MLSACSRRLGGQTLVLFACTFTCLLIGMAFIFDVGSLLIQRRVAQDAVDAGVLAGAQALGLQKTDAVIRDTITSYVAGTTGPWTTSVVIAARTYYVDVHNQNIGQIGQGLPNPAPFGIHVEVQRTIPATFGRVAGVNFLTASAVASAAAGIGPVDIMIALDTTGSMGDNGFNAERNAVHDFVQAMGLIKNDPTNVSVRIGMARFQGSVCSDNNSDGLDSSTNCVGTAMPWDDATILSQLTNDPDTLMTIACGNATSSPNSCPNDYISISPSTIKLPLPLNLDGDTVVASPSGYITPLGGPLTYIGAGCCPSFAHTPAAWTEVSGTKLTNAFKVMQGTLAGQPTPNTYWAWADPTRPTARKVLVMMTDGQDNSGTSTTAINAAATALKTNAQDNVTIYTVGYFDLGTSNITIRLQPYGCPGPLWPPKDSSGVTVSPSASDTLMHDLSSSGPHDCNYYAPLLKTDADLPAAFLRIAGKIQAGRLMS